MITFTKFHILIFKQMSMQHRIFDENQIKQF